MMPRAHDGMYARGRGMERKEKGTQARSVHFLSASNAGKEERSANCGGVIRYQRRPLFLSLDP